jgi:hypothetical protein
MRWEDASKWRSVEKSIEAATSTANPDMTDIPALVAQRVSNLLEAARLMTSGEVLPEGVTMPESLDNLHYVLPSPTDAAKAIASAKITRKAKENDIPALIRQAFHDAPIGTFMKVSEIRRQIAKNGTKADSGWDGRISAALFSEKGVNGLESVEIGHKAYARHGSRKGAIKVESPIWDEMSEESDMSDESDES